MASYTTPGVYVEEISTLPPSVAEVSTAVPVFIGYTEKSGDLLYTPTKINTMLEFEEMFGKAFPMSFEVLVTGGSTTDRIDIHKTMDDKFFLYYSLKLYFDNGGGGCYIISTGDFSSIPMAEHFKKALESLKKEDEPTLILLTDAISLGKGEYYNLCQLALLQCGKLGDRFLIADVIEQDGLMLDVKNFRDSIGINELKYGAAYTPYLQTLIPYQYTEDSVSVMVETKPFKSYVQENAIEVTYNNAVQGIPTIKIVEGANSECNFKLTGISLEIRNVKSLKGKDVAGKWTEWVSKNAPGGFNVRINGTGEQGINAVDPALVITETKPLKSYIQENAIEVTYNGAVQGIPTINIVKGTTSECSFKLTGISLEIRNVKGLKGKDVAGKWTEWVPKNAPAGFNVKINGSGEQEINSVTSTSLKTSDKGTSLGSKRDSNTIQYNKIKTELAKQKLTLPPSGAIAGTYAKTDRERGVWKSPANISLNSVTGPTFKINDSEQESLNVDPEAGKSINVIRSFTGKGTLVWGARTLAGNDNEWRYISVRRLFNLIEESTKKSTSFAVFEGNDATTWLKVKAMIDSYLYSLWQQGALAGSNPEAAYYVNIGLGKTMTAQDVLEGRLLVEIGIAAVRPAEFIVIKFMHKLQEA